MNAFNIAQTLVDTAARIPYNAAIVIPSGRDSKGRARFIQYTFLQLNQESDYYAWGFSEYGIKQGDRVLLMVRPGMELVAITFALFKIGAVPVLIDPGMGRKAFLNCVAQSQPSGFIGIPLAHLLRVPFPKYYKSVRQVITVGRRWFWGGAIIEQLRTVKKDPYPFAPTTFDDEAAITFTSGSTGPAKGVVYTHGMFGAQVDVLRNEFGIRDGDVDLPGLYIFALFDPALGVTVVFPDMDVTKPSKVDPAGLVESIETHGVTMSFGSPTIWKRVSKYCIDNEIELPALKRVMMAGAPVPPWLIDSFSHILPNGEIYTPFGATEALPIANMSGREILDETADLSKRGKGNCVGREVQGMTVRIIPISDEPISEWNDSLTLPTGQVGEIVVKGPVVTQLYLNQPRPTALAKIKNRDGSAWHRMGDIGYLDEKGRLWFCGRKSHRVETPQGLVLPVTCEAIFNQHPDVLRTALVGVGKYGKQRPILVVEPKEGKLPKSEAERKSFKEGLLVLGAEHEHTKDIKDILFYEKGFPVDVRHNAKIQREKLALWAKERLS